MNDSNKGRGFKYIAKGFDSVYRRILKVKRRRI